jgi:two-component sensor histidine kinase
MLAPTGRDAELGCATLGRAGLDCRAGRGLPDLTAVPLDAIDALVLTAEALTVSAVAALKARLEAQAGWSNLTVVLLLDRRQAEAAGPRSAHLRPLLTRPGTVVLRRPIDAGTLISVVRAAVADRDRQFALLAELKAREAAEDRARTLADELKHRVKNGFTLTLSIAQQTFRTAATLADARAALTGRIAAMIRAQDLLGEGADDPVELREVVALTLTPHRPAGDPGRIDVDGPRTVLAPGKARALSMALHELATNAAKYGALSGETGRVVVRWRVGEAAEGGIVFTWREENGPPVAPPTRRGFGSMLVERALKHDLDGQARLDFDPAGVFCEIRLPVSGA